MYEYSTISLNSSIEDHGVEALEEWLRTGDESNPFDWLQRISDWKVSYEDDDQEQENEEEDENEEGLLQEDERHLKEEQQQSKREEQRKRAEEEGHTMIHKELK